MGGHHGHGQGHAQAQAQGHAHGHGGADLDWGAMGDTLERRGELYLPLYRQIIDDVREMAAAPRRMLDAGSGPGVISALLAESFPDAAVTAVDEAPELLRRARERAERIGMGDRVATLQAELPDGLGDLADLDLVWLGQALHHIGDQGAALGEFARRMAPGGVLVLLEGGLPARYLPRQFGIGRPGLEARIDALHAEWFAEMRAGLPGAKEEPEDWSALLAGAGLRHVVSRTYLLDLPAPLSETGREHVVATVSRMRDGLLDGLTSEDRRTLDRLLDPADPESLHQRPDVFVLDAQTVHFAALPGSSD
ncbi:class I SAM-dependent methyltransferase [Streptomyces triticagri]|uniref:Class I SAM-dependent methyltransferase n=1 Tax=Streptomyces triticagri TaxID=2293568 RepID=A0A372M586_9ACTN|nr:methyltransferase domain-containing protein [Streptomyces triticagri]RFU85790.1 class I SAM-dependent methyltransferase [Streptomyces triticagri]